MSWFFGTGKRKAEQPAAPSAQDPSVEFARISLDLEKMDKTIDNTEKEIKTLMEKARALPRLKDGTVHPSKKQGAHAPGLRRPNIAELLPATPPRSRTLPLSQRPPTSSRSSRSKRPS